MVLEKSRKVPGGKLVQIQIELNAPQNNRPETIANIRITGDFFIYPEEGLKSLEEVLIDLPTTTSIESLTNHLDFARRKNSLQLIGFTPFDVATLIREVLDERP
jgi:lipoate-protein ligase A